MADSVQEWRPAVANARSYMCRLEVGLTIFLACETVWANGRRDVLEREHRLVPVSPTGPYGCTPK
jgi:hypothetical protein